MARFAQPFDRLRTEQPGGSKTTGYRSLKCLNWFPDSVLPGKDFYPIIKDVELCVLFRNAQCVENDLTIFSGVLWP